MFTRVLLALLLSLAPLAALEKNAIVPTMEKTVEAIISMTKDPSLKTDERHAKIDAMVSPLFDFGLMARLSLGKSAWSNANGKQRREFVDLYTERLKTSYLEKLDLYTDEKIVFEHLEPVKNRLHLTSFILQKGERKEVVYKFYRSKSGGWLIYDVDVLGVSIIQSYRSQFADILKDNPFDTLLDKLRAVDA